MPNESTAIEIVDQTKARALAVREDYELTVEEVVAQADKIRDVIKAVMKEGEHYGAVPGTDGRRVLKKGGAEKLLLVFRLDPQYQTVERREGGHLTVTSTCVLYHIPTGQRRGSGMGSCSTRESKYAYRKGGRVCPKCGADAIIKGRADWGGGYVCFKKKGGCGAKFDDGDRAIESQEVGRVANPDLADTENTVLKMANKRSLIAAVLNVTAASDSFTQDEGDDDGGGADDHDDERPRERSRSPRNADASSDYLAQIVEARSIEELEAIGHTLNQRAASLTEVQQRALRKSWSAKRDELQRRAVMGTPPRDAEPPDEPRRSFGDAHYKSD